MPPGIDVEVTVVLVCTTYAPVAFLEPADIREFNMKICAHPKMSRVPALRFTEDASEGCLF
jgi:hypothetical protein